MQEERCTASFSMLWPPTLKQEAESIARRRGLSLGALLRSLIAQEGDMDQAGESPAAKRTGKLDEGSP